MQPVAALRHRQLLLGRKSLLQVAEPWWSPVEPSDWLMMLDDPMDPWDFHDTMTRRPHGWDRWELLGYTDLTNNPAGRIYNRNPG